MFKLLSIIVIRTISDVSFKAAMHRSVGIRASAWERVRFLLTTPFFWSGVLFGILNVLVWASVLREFDLSFAYPFLGFSFVTIILCGKFFFNETLDRYKVMGIVCISIGSVLLFLQ
ncbi:hypothetical protein EBR96_01050 [bacterium]|nr:hypothetical protein [bacterium]